MSKKFKKIISQQTKQFLIVATAISAIIIAVWIDASNRSSQSPLEYLNSSRTAGEEGADLKIIEFADFQSRDAALGYTILEQYSSEFPGQIIRSVKYLPDLTLHAMLSAFYAECAAVQNKFFEFEKKLYKTQWQWKKEEDPSAVLNSYAKDLNLDMQTFEMCTADKATKITIEKEKTLGESYFVRMAPTYWIDGKMLVGSDELNSYLSEYFNVPKKEMTIENLYINQEGLEE